MALSSRVGDRNRKRFCGFLIGVSVFDHLGCQCCFAGRLGEQIEMIVVWFDPDDCLVVDSDDGIDSSVFYEPATWLSATTTASR